MISVRKALYGQTTSFIFALLLPFSSYWRLGNSTFPGLLDLYVVPVFYLSDLALAAFLLTGVIKFFREGIPKRRLYIFAAPLLSFGGLALLTAPFALDPALAGYTALRWLIAAAVSLRFLQGDIHLPSFVKVFVAGLLVHVAVGVGQVLAQGPLGLAGEMALPLTQPGVAIVALAGRNWLRAYGMTFHPNVLGGYLVVALLLGMPLLSRRFGWILLWWTLWGGLFLTFSRSAALAAILTVPVLAAWLFWKQPSGRRSLATALAGVALIGAVGGVIFAEQLLVRLRTATATEALSITERGAQIQTAIGILAARPLNGVGAGNFPLAVQPSATARRPLPVHNVPLLLASEVGVLGGALWIWIFLAALVMLIREGRRLNVWAFSGLCAWLALCIIALFDYYPWGLNTGCLLSATILGLTSCAILEEDSLEQ